MKDRVAVWNCCVPDHPASNDVEPDARWEGIGIMFAVHLKHRHIDEGLHQIYSERGGK